MLLAIGPSQALFTPPPWLFNCVFPLMLLVIALFPDKIFLYKLAPNAPSNILINPPFFSLVSFWVVSLTPFNNKSESLRDLTIWIMSFISSFDIISAVVFGAEDRGQRTREEKWRQPDPKIFLCILASAADAAAVNPKGIKTLS